MSRKNPVQTKKQKNKVQTVKDQLVQLPSFWSNKRFILGAVVSIFITFFCFLNTKNNQFVNWDDDRNFYENELITSLNSENFWSNTKKIFTTDVIGNYNPLSIWTFALEKQMYGFDSPGYWHLTNVFLHLICVFFVYRISLLLGLRFYGALVVALLFGIHPMRVESVAWVTERKDVLFGAFYLSALFFYIKGKLSSKNYWYIIVPLFILSLFSKIQAVILPLSMVAVDYYLSGKLDVKSIIRKTPYFLLSLIFGVLGILMLSDQGSLENANTYPFWQRLFVGTFSYLIYIVKLFLPYELSPLYPYPPKMPAYFYPTLLVIPAVLYGLWYCYKNEKRVWFFGIFFFTVNVMFLLQVIGAGQGFLADRFTYMAYFGLFFIAGYYVDAFTVDSRYKKYVFAGGALLLSVFAFMTVQQNKHWENSETLWTKVLQHYDQTVLPYGNRANYLRDQGRIQEALNDYSQAIRLKPKNEQAYNSRARLYFDTGKTRDTLMLALQDYTKAIELTPDDGEFYVNRGATYARLGNIDRAIQDMNKGLELKPDHAVGYLNRSVMYNSQNNVPKALEDIESYLRLKPYNADLWYEKARAQRSLNKLPEAIQSYNRAIQLKNNSGLFYYERSRTLDAMNQTAQAKLDLQKAIAYGYKNIDPAFRQKILR